MTKDNDPTWLKSMKKEADKLGVPLKDLLVMKTRSPRTPANKGKKKTATMTASKGGMPTVKKKPKTMMNYGGMAKKKKY
tara:strand:+ start:229 stop:465 length:237 start_codon:yes stop_codon:yes gene_type:complete